MVAPTADLFVVYSEKVRKTIIMEDVWGSLLSEESKQRVKKKLKRNNDTGEWPRENSSDSAVMVPLISVEGEPSVLFTLRSAQLSRHRNQVR